MIPSSNFFTYLTATISYESIVFVHLKNIEKDSEVYNIFCNFAI